MAKDEAIRNQKVFVRLDNVMQLQRVYGEACRYEEQRRSEGQFDAANAAYRRGLGKAIQLLELPISLSTRE